MFIAVFNEKNVTKKHRLEIETIDKVHNELLMQRFKEKELQYRKTYGHVKTVKVFHGTKQSNISSILKNNLEVNLHGQHIGMPALLLNVSIVSSNFFGLITYFLILGHRFGAGVSFSAYASYASYYCDQSLQDMMLLCNVLVSNIVEVPENRNRQTVLSEPPLIPNMFPLRYDTTAKNKHTMDVIVKFENNTFYPAYVINFRRCSQSSFQSHCDAELEKLIKSMGSFYFD